MLSHQITQLCHLLSCTLPWPFHRLSALPTPIPCPLLSGNVIEVLILLISHIQKRIDMAPLAPRCATVPPLIAQSIDYTQRNEKHIKQDVEAEVRDEAVLVARRVAGLEDLSAYNQYIPPGFDIVGKMEKKKKNKRQTSEGGCKTHLRSSGISSRPRNESHGEHGRFLRLPRDVARDEREEQVALGEDELRAVEGD